MQNSTLKLCGMLKVYGSDSCFTIHFTAQWNLQNVDEKFVSVKLSLSAVLKNKHTSRCF